jgi:hypothetical protein
VVEFVLQKDPGRLQIGGLFVKLPVRVKQGNQRLQISQYGLPSHCGWYVFFP